MKHFIKTYSGQKGLSVLELVVAIPATLALAAGGWALTHALFVGSMRASQGDRASSELVQAFEHVLRVGRLARGCQKYFDPEATVATGFECTVDFANKGVSYPVTNSRFLVAPIDGGASVLQYQTRSGLDPNEAWTLSLAYDAIMGFEICDVYDMNSTDLSRCTLNSQDGSGVGDLKTADPNFFRVRLQTRGIPTKKSNGTIFYAGRGSIKGSFFIRNGNANGLAGVVYDWGSGL